MIFQLVETRRPQTWGGGDPGIRPSGTGRDPEIYKIRVRQIGDPGREGDPKDTWGTSICACFLMISVLAGIEMLILVS